MKCAAGVSGDLDCSALNPNSRKNVLGDRNWSLRQSLHHSRQSLRQVVVDHHHREQHEEDERCLVDSFFNLQADVAAHDAFDEQQQDYAAIEDGNRQQVEDAKIQADRGGQRHKGSPAFFRGCFSCGAANPDRAFDGPDRDLALNHFLYELKDQQRAFFVLLDRLAESDGQGQGAYFHRQAAKTDTIAFLLLAGNVGQHWLHGESSFLAIAADCNLDRLPLGTLQSLDHRLDGRDWLAVESQDFVAESYSSLLRRHILFQFRNRDAGLFGNPSRVSHLVYAVGFGHDGLVKRLSAALDGHIERLIRAQGLFGVNLLPGGILNPV